MTIRKNAPPIKEPTPPRPLRDVDSRDHSEWFRLGLAIVLTLTVFELFLFRAERISRPAWIFLFWLGNPALAFLLTWGALTLFEKLGHGLIGSLTAATSTAPLRQYSEQESLVIRGRYAEAADMYRAVIAEEPGNIEVRLLLASLLEQKLHDPGAAEAVWLEVRSLDPTSRQELAIANNLIELYRRAGRLDDLRNELKRMARLRAGSPEGEGARRHLRELVGE